MRPYTDLSDEMLSDLGRIMDRFAPAPCPDFLARIRAEVADLPKPRRVSRWMLECLDAAGNCFATLARARDPWTDTDEDQEEAQVLAAYARKFDLPFDEIEWDRDTDIICHKDKAIGCLSVGPLR